MRLFIAINFSENIQSALRERLTPLQREIPPKAGKIRWIPPDQWHLTLKFIGSYADHQVATLEWALSAAVKTIAPFEMALEGMGCFPSTGPPSILWVGVQQGIVKIQQAAALIEEACSRLGIPEEKRPFSPHLTIAKVRFSPPSGHLRSLVQNYVCAPVGPIPVTSIDLMQSVLSAAGPAYTCLRKFPLA